MRNAVLLLLAVFFSITTAHADKTTTDPNQAAVTRQQPVVEVDKRLQQKVTYTSGSVRLHTIAEELTKMTGVSIYAGSGSKDWQVRDVPVCVNVKDMPLNDLLDTLAVCVHARLGSERMTDDPKAPKSYRIYRRTGEEIKLQSVRETVDAEVSWAWDCVTALKSATPETKAKFDRETLLFSEIIASLGPDAKTRLLNREHVFIDAKGSPQRVWLTQLQDAALAREITSAKENKQPLPEASQDPDAAVMRMVIRGDGPGQTLTVYANMSPVDCQRDLLETAQHIQRWARDLKLPARPAKEPTDPAMADLATPSGWERMIELQADILDKEIDLEWKPKDVEPQYNDLITALVEKTGVNIIREDFSSHHRNESPSMRSKFVPKTTLRKALLGGFSINWYFNKSTNTIMVWEWDWRHKHVNLVPESLVVKLQDKMNGEGVEFEDILPLLSLSEDQLMHWIAYHKDLGPLGHIRDSVFWNFIGQLPTEEQAMAMSEQGLHIGSLDKAWVASYFVNYENAYFRKWTSSLQGDRVRMEESKRKIEPMTDEAIAKTVVLRIKSEPAPGDESKRRYYMELDLTKNGEHETRRVCGMYPPFPVFSSARQAEINKAKEQK